MEKEIKELINNLTNLKNSMDIISLKLYRQELYNLIGNTGNNTLDIIYQSTRDHLYKFDSLLQDNQIRAFNDDIKQLIRSFE